MNTLIRNGTVVTADETKLADVWIEGETIREVRAGIAADGIENVIDAAGMYVLPGGIDCHTHLDMPFGGTTSADDFETGTRAAAFGGTTSIVDFAIQARGTRMRDALDTWMKKAEGKACIDYGLHMIVTDLGACGLEDMDELVDEGRRQLQAVHGLSERPDGGRRDDLQGPLAHREERCADLHARRERQRDRRNHRARAGRR
jgi:dihydropyrimidinase